MWERVSSGGGGVGEYSLFFVGWIEHCGTLYVVPLCAVEGKACVGVHDKVLGSVHYVIWLVGEC